MSPPTAKLQRCLCCHGNFQYPEVSHILLLIKAINATNVNLLELEMTTYGG